MKYDYSFIPKSECDKEDIAWFERQWPNHQVIGFLTEPNITRIVLKMKPGHKGWTPYMCARDCGDHYIVAMYAQYNRIDKKTKEVTYDVEDK